MGKGLIGQAGLRYRWVLIPRSTWLSIYRTPPPSLLVGVLTYVILRGQGLGSLLIRKIDGDYNNVVGFPGASFFQFLNILVEEEVDFLEL